MSNIPEFYLTNRELKELLWMSGLSENYIKSLPENAVVLEIGGGLDQNFAEGVKKLRPDIKPITIDPTIIIGSDNKNSFDIYYRKDPKNSGKFKYAQYLRKVKWYQDRKLKPEKDSIKVENQKEFSKTRIQRAHETGFPIAALAPQIPLRDESIDLIIDIYGPGIYLQTKENPSLDKYLKEIYRILKPGGVARIFPAVDVQVQVDKINGNLDQDDDIKLDIQTTHEFYKNICQKDNLNFDLNFKIIQDTISKEEALVLVLKKTV